MLSLNINDKDVLNAVLSAMPEIFFIYDKNGYYIQVLGGVDHKNYHDGQHLVGKCLHDVMEKKIADQFLAQIRNALDAQKVIHYVYQLSASDIKGSENLPGPKGKLWFEAHISPLKKIQGHPRMVVWVAFNITKLKQTLNDKENLISKLQEAKKEIKELHDMLPICSGCKKIRNSKGDWEQIDSYIESRSGTSFTHSMCPECLDKLYGTEEWYIDMRKNENQGS